MSYTANFAIKEIKGRTIISNKQNLKTKFSDGFYASENQNKRKIKLKTELTKTKL